MIIKEAIEFKRGQDSKNSLDVGKNSSHQVEERFYKLGNIIMIRDTAKEDVMENIGDYEDAIYNLLEVDIDPSEIRIINSGRIEIPIYRIYQSMNGSFNFLFEKDAREVLDLLKKTDMDYSKWGSEYRIEKDRYGNYYTVEELKKLWKNKQWPWEPASFENL